MDFRNFPDNLSKAERQRLGAVLLAIGVVLLVAGLIVIATSPS